jgi:two-component system sensor histidine kinase TctE
LRTPLAALNGQVDLLSRDDVSPRGQKNLERVRERVGQLARLANQLLSHAMIAHRTQAVAGTRLDLVEVTRRALDEVIPDTLERDILVTLHPPPKTLMMWGDPVNLAEAIKNIVDNAVRHGAPAEIAVRVFTENGRAIVEVEDDGPGIPPALWQRALQRFGASRSEGKGSGLGLSIAAEVAAAHGGGVAFRERGKVGFVVALSFAIDGRERL